jgi:uncharacterized protein (TIGR03792 family)
VLRETFIRKDYEIWTAYLQTRPGFLKKEVWISPKNLDEVVLVITWESFERWYAVPKPELDATEKRFAKAVGRVYQKVGSSAYQIRKTSHSTATVTP